MLKNQIERLREIESIHKGDCKNKHNMYSRNICGLPSAAALMMLLFLLGSCHAVGEVFKAGMGFGVFIVVAIVIALMFLVMRMRKNKSS